MRVHLRFLRHSGKLQEALHSDGWTLQRARDEMLFAHHPEVTDEPTARRRLHRLGLLTSASVHIQFEPAQAPHQYDTARL